MVEGSKTKKVENGNENYQVAELGSSVPSYTPHAVSVSLPLWQDNVDYELGLDRVKNVMRSGYPRFFIHLDIRKLADICKSAHGLNPDERCMIFPSERSAELCRQFIRDTQLRRDRSGPGKNSITSPNSCRIVQVEVSSSNLRIINNKITPDDIEGDGVKRDGGLKSYFSSHKIFTVYVPDEETYGIARAFWQHTGLGISSRFAERCLRLLGSCPVGEESARRDSPTEPSSSSPNLQSPPLTPRSTSGLKRYSTNKNTTTKLNLSRTVTAKDPIVSSPDDEINEEGSSVYVEERYGRNLPIQQAQIAKLSLRRRIADILSSSNDNSHDPDSTTARLKRSQRGVGTLTDRDVYLSPTGMSSIFYAHQLCMKLQESSDSSSRPEGDRKRRKRVGRSVCFGFPYTDTLKIIQKWGPGEYFFGNGDEEDLESLEKLLIGLENGKRPSKSSQSDGEDDGEEGEEEEEPMISALFCEFPSNPLLKSPNLRRLRELADRFKFLIVIDETIGNFVNVEVLTYSDILVSSLTKVFSGDSNVMGGSLILNPSQKNYKSLKGLLEGEGQIQGIYEDIYFGEDAIYMERNSRDFKRRARIINENALHLCESLLELKKIRPGVIKDVNYPLYVTNQNYEACRRRRRRRRRRSDDGGEENLNASNGRNSNGEERSKGLAEEEEEEEEEEEGGYGGLFSLTFTSEPISRKFYDCLRTYKGPSLGTNFTLVSPYVILAHFYEFEWVTNFGVDPNLIRVSVGLEDKDELVLKFEEAFEEAYKLV